MTIKEMFNANIDMSYDDICICIVNLIILVGENILLMI